MKRQFSDAELVAAREALERKRAEMRIQTKDYKKDWLDENWWLDLAKSRGFRLPPMYVPTTVKGLKKWARKLGKTPFLEHFGCSPKGLIDRNPKTPLRAFVGQMLEP